MSPLSIRRFTLAHEIKHEAHVVAISPLRLMLGLLLKR